MKVIDRVENFLKANSIYRNSDKRLLLDYWEKQGLVLTDEQRQIFYDRCTTAETITRARRALKDKYPASAEVDKARYDRFKEFKNEQAISWLND